MVNIDYIMDLLDWNNSMEKQEQGIALAKDVKCINVFLQPGVVIMEKMFGTIVQKFYLQGQMKNCPHT